MVRRILLSIQKDKNRWYKKQFFSESLFLLVLCAKREGKIGGRREEKNLKGKKEILGVRL